MDKTSPLLEPLTGSYQSNTHKSTPSFYSLVPVYIRWLLCLASLLSIVEGTIQPFRNLLLGQFTSIFSEYASVISPNESHAKSKFALSLNELLMYAFVLALAAWLVSAAQSFVFKLIAQMQVQSLRTRYMNALLASDSVWRESNSSQLLIQSISSDIDRIETVISEKLPWVIRNLVVFIFGSYLALHSSVKLSLAILAVFPVVGAVLGYMHHTSSVFDKKLRESYRYAGLVAHEVFISIKTVMAFNRQFYESVRYTSHLAEACAVHQQKCIFDGFGWGSYSFTMLCAFAVSFYVGGKLVAANEITPGDVLNSFSQIAVGITALGNIGQASREFQYGFLVLHALLVQLGQLEDPGQTHVGIEPPRFIGKIEFKNVWFRYPSRINRWVLQDFSLTLNPGQVVAFVGPSGCGKSTVLHLLTGLYKPDSGTVLLDGVDITTISTLWLRKHMGISSQNSDLFDGSIHYNVSLGIHGNTDQVSRSVVQNACNISQASTFINELPDGYDTDISGLHTSLSGGQIQRLAIARAYLGAESGMLILDEATSALDTSTERLVMNSLIESRKNKTILCVSHRVASLTEFTRIIVFKEGHVAEDGSFEKLTESQTIFKTLLETRQTSAYSTTAAIPLVNTPTVDNRHGLLRKRSSASAEIQPMDDCSEEPFLSKSINVKGGANPMKSDGPFNELFDRLFRSFQFFKRVWLETKQEWPYLLIGYIGSTIEGLQSPLQGFVIGKVVAGYALPTSDQITASTNFWSLAMIIIGMCSLVAAVMNAVGFGYAASRNMYKLREKIFQHVVYQDMEFFGDPMYTPTNLELVLADSTEKIGTVSGNLLADILRSVVNLTVGIYIGVSNSWMMAVLMVLPFPVILLIGAGLARISARFAEKYQMLQENSAKFTSQMITKLQTISLLAKERHFSIRYSALLREFTTINTKHQFVVSLSQGVLESMIILVFSLGLFAGGNLMLWGWVTNERVLVSLVTLTLTAASINQLSASISYALGPASVAVHGVFDILDRKPVITIGNMSTMLQSRDAITDKDPFTGIELDNVTFSYPSYKSSHSSITPVLSQISITIEPGHKVALVGPTGSGKSSVLALVQRLYDPQHGTIKLNNQSLQSWDLALLKSHIGVVPQFPDMFDASVRHNIAYGCSGATIETIEHAAKLANAHEFILALPNGYETCVGERANLLSGGQRQRLAIARIYLMQPSLIILDEATSALDAENEAAVIGALETYSRDSGKGLLVVTHRLDTIRDATCIHVLDHGHIVSSGTHETLLQQSDLYVKLVSKSDSK
ncbi:ATP-dependent permease [Batrachochytrium dendrobatidis]